MGELEELAEEQLIDLYYGDEARVSTEPCIPYGWQFADEDVFFPSEKSGGVNCFALLSRNNQCRFETTQKYITAEFIFEQLEKLSFGLPRLTVIVLDNASIHTGCHYQRAVGGVARARVVRLLFTALFTALEHCRSVVAKVKIRMAVAT